MTSTEDQDLQISDTNAPMETSTMDMTTTSPVSVTSQTKSQLNLGVEQIISNIKDMQTREMKLYTDLDNPQLTEAQRTNIIDQINQIGETRSTLYNSLNNMASSYQQNVSTSQNTLQQQVFALDIVENELNEAKVRMKALETQKYNKLRLVEINTYYGKRFSAHKEIVKVVVYVCIFMLITIILGKKEILPRNIYITLNGMIIVIGIIVIGKKVIDLSNRDNMNFDEYDWYFDKSKAPVDTSTTGTGSDPWATVSTTCIGEACCPPNEEGSPNLMMYDSVKKVCVLNTDTSLQAAPAEPTTTTTTTTETTEPLTNMSKFLRSPFKYL
jgi:hypothetical protein